METFEHILSVALQFLLLLSLLAVAFGGGCVAMFVYRGPIRWRRFRGGPFRSQYNLGARRPSDLYLHVTSAIANPGTRVGPRPGPSWPEGHPAWAEREETQASWAARAVLYELGVGVRLKKRTQTMTAFVPVAVPLAELDSAVEWAEEERVKAMAPEGEEPPAS
jgi:hypothetical protein